MALVHHQDGLRPIGEAMGAVIVGLDRVIARKAGKSVIQNLADTQGWEAPEEGSERYRMLDCALASRGMAYRFRGGDGAHDGWSLAKACAEYAGQRDCIDAERELSSWGVTEAEARKVLTQWGLSEVRVRHAAPGDLLLFGMSDQPLPGGRTMKGGIHVAVMSAPGGELSWSMLPGRKLAEARMVHAYPVRAVIESWVGPYWSEKLIAVFSYDTPGAPLRAVMRRAA